MKIIIIGAGIAGILLAERLLQYRPLIVAPPENPSPMTALCHPFPGRSVRPHPLLKEAVFTAAKQYRAWHKHFPQLCRPLRMHRPIVGAGGQRLLKSAQKYEAYYAESDITLELIDNQMANKDLPFQNSIAATELVYEPAFAIDLQMLIPKRLKQLVTQGCEWLKETVLDYNATQITLSSGKEIEFDLLIFAVGSQLKSFFPQLNLIYEGGSLLQVPTLIHKDAYSINGIHLTPNAKGESVVGSTRWTGSAPTPLECQSTLIERTKAILKADHSVQPGVIWRGTRCIYPHDRLPICGRVPNISQVAILGALGNKGLLWGPITAKVLVDHLLHGTTLPPELSIDRIKAHRT